MPKSSAVKPERIAVAIDFSPESELALEEGIALARAVGGEVHMIAVVGTLDVDDDSADLRELAAEIQREVREKLADLHERFDGRGPSISQTIAFGAIAPSICQAAAEQGCRTLVVGTHGRTGVRRFFLGSIAEKVARIAECDVLISRGSRGRRGYRRILVPTDFSRPAERALARAVELAAPDAEIDLVHVWQLPAPMANHYAPLASHAAALRRVASSMRADALAQAEPLLAKYRRDGVGIDFAAVNGSPGGAIIDRASGCDLIAIGTHGRRGLARVALGSIAERTIRHAPCSVLVTHAENPEEIS